MELEQGIRAALLSYIELQIRHNGPDVNLQTNIMMGHVVEQFGSKQDAELARTILDEVHELFRTGYLSWGMDLFNSAPPHFHVTKRGKQALRNLSRDPANPAGYRAYVEGTLNLNPIAASYLMEGLACYIGGNHKAAAVMVGAAAESLALELRDLIVDRLEVSGQKPSKDMTEWRISRILTALEAFFDYNKKAIPNSLYESIRSYWPSYFQFIRSARNDAGHPNSVDPITPEMAHAALLIFPELGKLVENIREWALKYDPHMPER